MKISKKQITLEEGLKKEWMITNGIGGFSSSTVLGCNTRKYHGLLVAPLTPPARRHLILSKLDESITVGDKEYPLYTNVCRQYISEGYKYLEEFEKDYFPIYTYKIEDIEIKKIICMEYGKNAVCILYRIKNTFIKRISNIKKTSNYLKTFILGDTNLIDTEVFKSYQINGISHLFSISGMHISLFSTILLFILNKLFHNKKINYVGR